MKTTPSGVLDFLGYLEHVGEMRNISPDGVTEIARTLSNFHGDVIAYCLGKGWTEGEGECGACLTVAGRGVLAESRLTPTPHVDDRVDDDAFLSPSKLARIFGVEPDPLRQRLNRFRRTNDDGWMEDPDRKARGAKYMYRVGAVRSIIAKPKTTSERPHKKN